MMVAMVAHDTPTLSPEAGDDRERAAARTPGLLTLLFELSLAVALPPAAILSPPGAVRPLVHSDSYAIVDPVELAAILERPIAEVGRGQVALGEVDARLGGLVVELDVFRVADRSGALISLGVVRPDPAGAGGATPANLWGLARAALRRQGVAYEDLVGLGEDAFLAVHGGRTARSPRWPATGW